jgi:hypothetical protein
MAQNDYGRLTMEHIIADRPRILVERYSAGQALADGIQNPVFNGRARNLYVVTGGAKTSVIPISD